MIAQHHKERYGDWMQTFTGKKFYPLDPNPDEVDIRDIAHALSLICRYGGHCLKFYSVAEHSILVSRALPDDLKLAGLLHDAAEAYLGDKIRPIKPFIPKFEQLEINILYCISVRFGDPNILRNTTVKETDAAILKDEQEQNMSEPPEKWYVIGKGLNINLEFWDPETAEKAFLNEFNRIWQGQ